jgi:hypothetical protein
MQTSSRPARAIVAILAATLALISVIGPVAAGSPEQVEIVSHMNFNPDGPNFGDFTASGAAVESGLVCASGSVVDTGIVFGGFQSGRGAQILVRKTFTCDGGGTFFVKIQVHLDFETSTESFTWLVLGGTGAYANLRGSGDGSTVSDGSDPQTGNFNTYVGGLH